MKLYSLALLALLLTGCTSPAQVNEWHPLTQLTASQRSSESYRFLVGKFGASHILTECDAEEASLLGDEYLFQIMGSGNGETIGHGTTLQDALDSAMRSYMTPARVAAIEKQMQEEEKERQRREEVYRKKCCSQGAVK